MLDHEVTIARTAVMVDQHLDGRMQIFELVGRGRVDGQQAVAADHRAGIDALRKGLGQCRLADAEGTVEDDDHQVASLR